MHTSPAARGSGEARPVRDLRVLQHLEELVDLVKGQADVYLRFSKGPAADADSPSRDYEADLELPGLSVTPLGIPSWWSRPAADWVARQVCKYIDIAEKSDDRRAWVLIGREVSRGPDHEPIVVDVKALAWLGDDLLASARMRYHERFDVGESSTGGVGEDSRETT